MPSPSIQNNANSYATFATSFGKAPMSGPRALPATAYFTGTINQVLFDLGKAREQDKLEFIQAVFIDNSANSQPFSLTLASTGQVITIGPNSQGYLPIEATNAAQFIGSIPTAASVNVNLQFLNHPVPAEVWYVNSTLPVNNTSPGNQIDGSGSTIPVFQGTVNYSGKIQAASNILINYQNSPYAPFLTSINLQLSGDATIASAGEFVVQVTESNNTANIFAQATCYLPSSVPANPVPNYTIYNVTGILLLLYPYDGFRIITSAALTNGWLSYNLMGGGSIHTPSG